MDSDVGKLFIGGISWETSEEMLKAYFSVYGEVSEVVIMKDKATGRARGFGFVAFADPTVADGVLLEKHTIDGRTVEVKKAVRRDEQQSFPRGYNTPGSGSIPTSHIRTKKIFVGGLASTVTEEDFKRYFEKFGIITDVVVMCDHATQRPRGFGFITFESEDSVENVLQKPFHELNEKSVEVKRAIPKELQVAAGMRSPAGGYSGSAPRGGGSSYGYPAATFDSRGGRSGYPTSSAGVYGANAGYGAGMNGSYGGSAYGGGAYGSVAGGAYSGSTYGSAPATGYGTGEGNYGASGPATAGYGSGPGRNAWGAGTGYGSGTSNPGYGNGGGGGYGNTGGWTSSAGGKVPVTGSSGGYGAGGGGYGYSGTESGYSAAAGGYGGQSNGYVGGAGGYGGMTGSGSYGSGYGDGYGTSGYIDTAWRTGSADPYGAVPASAGAAGGGYGTGGATDAPVAASGGYGEGNSMAGRQSQRGP